MPPIVKSQVSQIACGALSCLVVLTIVGCGGAADDRVKLPVFPATGNLTLDGEPFGPATLRFVPPASGQPETANALPSVVAEAGANGEITNFTTYEKGDGAPAGTYTVAVVSTGGPGSKSIPAVYENEARSPLSVTIVEKTEGDTNSLTIALESKAGKPNATSTFQGIDPNAAAAGVTDK